LSVIRPADWRLLGLETPDRTPSATPEAGDASARKFVVALAHGAWRVTHDGTERGAFSGPAEATAFACALAREAAVPGVLGMVVVQAEVQELHCFIPGPAASRLSSVGVAKSSGH
jgi:hypothetical protein